MSEKWIDPVRWFEALGACRCGKKATGILRGPQNESYGPYCERCAYNRIEKAEKAREKQRQRHGLTTP